MFSFRKKVTWKGDKLAEQARRECERLAYRMADYCATLARAYAPVDTGFLVSSVGIERSPTATATVRVYVGAYYAQYVEFGYTTRAGTHVPPNPFLQRAIADTVERFPEFASQFRLTSPGDGVADLGVSFG